MSPQDIQQVITVCSAPFEKQYRNEYIIDVAFLQRKTPEKQGKTGVARIKMLFIQQQGRYE